MSIQLDAFSMTPNPVDAKGRLMISAKVTEIPDTPSAELLLWLDAAQPLQNGMLPNVAPDTSACAGMTLHNLVSTTTQGYLEFDGVDDHGIIQFDRQDDLDSWTLELVIYKENPYDGKTDEPIFCVKNTSSTLTMIHQYNGSVVFAGDYTSLVYLNAATTMHLCLVKSAGSNIIESYVDGYLFATTDVSNIGGGTLLLSYPLYLFTDNLTNRFGKFRFYGMRLYDGALTPEEILQKYQEGIHKQTEDPPQPVKDESLVMWMDYTQPPDNAQYEDAGVVDYIDKATGSGGYTKLYNINNTPDSGYYQNGVHFDGVDDHGEVCTDVLSTPHESFTIETAFDVGDPGSDSGICYWYTFNGAFNVILVSSSDNTITISHGMDFIFIPFENLENNLLHIVLTGDKNSWKVYLNKVLGAEMPYSEIITEQFVLSSNRELDYPTYYKTTFYTFRIYHKALTEAEINQNYEAVKASIETEG